MQTKELREVSHPTQTSELEVIVNTRYKTWILLQGLLKRRDRQRSITHARSDDRTEIVRSCVGLSDSFEGLDSLAVVAVQDLSYGSIVRRDITIGRLSLGVVTLTQIEEAKSVTYARYRATFGDE